MKTKMLTLILALAVTGFSYAQSNRVYASDDNSQFVAKTETYFGANLEYSAKGAKVIFISPDSPAESSSFKKGDIITSIGTINIDSEQSYKEAMATYKPDETVTVSFLRKDVPKQKKVKLDKTTVFTKAGSN